MKKSLYFLVPAILSITLSGASAVDCTGIPDLSRSFVQQGFQGQATLLVVPDGSGPPLTEARTTDGTVVDATIHVTLISFCEIEEPVAFFPREDLWLESLGAGLVACVGGAIADAPTDLDGHTQWSNPLKAGGWDEGNCRVIVNGVALGDPAGLTLNFNSPDLDGNGAVNLSDVAAFVMDYFGGYVFRSDLLHDGAINLSDVAVLAGSIGKICP